MIVTLQDCDGAEYNVEVSEAEFNKITAGGKLYYELANKYLQKEIERRNRLLAYKLLLKGPDEKKQHQQGMSNVEQGSGADGSKSKSGIVVDNEQTIQEYTTTTYVTDPELAANQNDTNLSLRWSDSETKQLIELYRQNFEKLHDRKYKAKLIYIEMAKHLLRFNPDQIESKIKNLKKTYKIILDNSIKTGRGRITWPYFERMQEILGSKPENNPISIASNRTGFQPQSPPVDVEENSESDSEIPMTKKPKLNLEEQHEPGPSRLNANNIKKRQSNAKPPEWVKEFRTELSQQHKERMEKQQQFLDLFKEWMSKSKE